MRCREVLSSAYILVLTVFSLIYIYPPLYLRSIDILFIYQGDEGYETI
jgi:hypothetical protein